MYLMLILTFQSGVLWVLWIAAASNTVRAVRILIALCNLRVNKKVGVLQAACRDVRASEAFGHLSWVVRKYN